MAVSKMKKLSVLTNRENLRALVARLCALRCVELSEEALGSEADGTALESGGDPVAKSALERDIAALTDALAVLHKYAKETKSLLDPKTCADVMRFDDTPEYAAARSLLAAVGKKLDRRAAIKSEIADAENLLASLLPFERADVPLETTGTARCALLLGSFSAGVTPDAVRAALDGTDTELAVLSDGKTQTTVGILCLKEDLERVNAALLPLGFIRATFPTGTGTASEAIRRMRAKIKTLGGEDAALIEGLKADAARVGLLEILSDFEKTKLAAYGAMAQSGQTHYTALLTGYLPARRQKAVEKALDAFDCDYAIEEVPDGEEAPVELRNNGFAKNFEWVMGMYSYPAYGTYDPTFIMSIFYFIIFGLMFADAGYGLLLVLAGFGAIRLLHPKPGMRAFLAMFGYCGISSMIWGVLMGSYFGDFPLAYMQHMTAMTEVPKTLALWFDPIQNPMNFLILSLGVGAVHLIAGMAVKFSVIWKSGKPLDAIFDIGSWWVLFAGLGLLAVKPEIGKWVALAGVAMLVLTQGRAEKNIIMKLGKGIFSLYDLISYGSDLLSYSRILALGLASAVIGQVVNILATLVGPSVGGFIAMVVIFIVGHLLNLVINVLGTFVHTSRLQYIEFFGKFFVDGGKPFRPLAPADEYTYREEKREE